MLNCIEKKLLDKKYTLGLVENFKNEIDFSSDFLVITNNPMIKSEFPKSIFVDGEFREVLIKTRDMIYSGYKIISFPLPASIRMIYSPIRTILVSSNPASLDEDSLRIIDESIQKYELIIGKRNIDVKNKKDYEIIDYDLTISAIKENGFVRCISKA